MTVVSALDVIGEFHSHSDLEKLEIEWGIHGRCRTSSKSAHIADLGKIVLEENPEVNTLAGRLKMSRAIIERALDAPPISRSREPWKKMLAGLHLDGFEIGEEKTPSKNPWEPPNLRFVLRRMMPDKIPGLDFKEAEDEIGQLLSSARMVTPKGHLDQAISAFSRGDWAAANAQLRTFYESYLDEIAVALGCNASISSKDKRDYLGKTNPPFFFENLNEWNANNSKPQYIQGLMSRMHPQGSHAGLSEEDDAAFRLQITLITARLFLRRFSKFVSLKGASKHP